MSMLPSVVVFPMDFLELGIYGTNFSLLGLGDIVLPGNNDYYTFVLSYYAQEYLLHYCVVMMQGNLLVKLLLLPW